jgi:hypothetical protein
MHPITIESRRKKTATLAKAYPQAAILDVTSKGEEPWVRFSPFYPHGGIPIPYSPREFAASVEGLWQGLKVFEKEDVDPSKWMITDMSGIKRSGKSRGKVLGHRFGIRSRLVLNYVGARYHIYLPAYRWVLENRLVAELNELQMMGKQQALVLLDYETNADVENLAKPLSHAALIKAFLEDTWPIDPRRA